MLRKIHGPVRLALNHFLGDHHFSIYVQVLYSVNKLGELDQVINLYKIFFISGKESFKLSFLNVDFTYLTLQITHVE